MACSVPVLIKLALKAWGALTLLFRKGFRGSYAEICHELGWFDRHGKPMKSMVSRAIRHAKDKGGIPKDATFQQQGGAA
jgi:hypothetical protein